MPRRNLTSNLPEVPLPYGAASQRYGVQVATLMERLQVSRAPSAKQHKASEFAWSLIYEQADDPETRDEALFLEQLASRSTIYLLARGFHWRDWEEIPKPVPSQIMVRFQERAKLICGQPSAPDPGQAVSGSSMTPTVPFSTLLQAFKAWCKSHPDADRRLVVIAEVTLVQLIKSETEK